MIAFSVVTETIFAWPGMGKLLIDSIQQLDRPVVVAYLMIIVLIFVVINLLVDILYSHARSAGPPAGRSGHDRHMSAADRPVGCRQTAGGPVETPFQRFLFPNSVAESSHRRGWPCSCCPGIIVVLAAHSRPGSRPQNPYDLAQVDVMDGPLPPGSEASTGLHFWLGSDGAGRDLYGRPSSTACGSQPLGVGVASGLIALVIGMAIGLCRRLFGWPGRCVDHAHRRPAACPFPASADRADAGCHPGQGIDKIIIALVVVQWAYYARTVRATALVERGKEYVEAARCLGLSHRHASSSATSCPIAWRR